MAFRIHTLRVSVVVAALGFMSRYFRSTYTCNASCGPANACADGRAVAAADGAANHRADRRPGKETARSCILLRPRRRLSADRIRSVLPATAFIEPELIEAFVGTR
jgi:hypothetical protein